MNSQNRSNLKLAAGVLLGLITALTVTAMADGDPTTDTVPRVLPYQGTLEFNGQPVHALGEDAIPMRFSLFDGPSSDTAIYNQELSIEVYAGRFTASIGPLGTNADGEEVTITEVIQAADDLYLGMTLLGDGENPDVALSNRQRIHASPYALWTTSATNLNVAANLSVRGDALFGGGVTVGEQGHLRLLNNDGASLNSDGALVVGGTRNITIDNSALIARDGASPAVLTVGSPTDVEGDLNVNGDLRVHNGTLRGRLELRQAIHTFTTSTTESITCDANEVPISCGVEKVDLTAGDEDSMGCFVDLERNRCRVWLDVASTQDGDQRGYCMCLRVSE